MLICDRLRAVREAKNLSQGDIEHRTGLLRCYISRVENGHTIPSVETLEKFARALDVPLYQLFYEGRKPPELRDPPIRKTAAGGPWGSTGKDARYLAKFRRLLGRTTERNRNLLFSMARQIAAQKPAPPRSAAES
jgi:transcriptional regulator with XRE-family HTH domain